MNTSIILMTLKQFINRPVRIFVLVCVAGMPLVISIMERHAGFASSNGVGTTAILEFTNMFVWVIAAGIIGQDVSDGILPLIFSRPLKRYEYVLSKWIAVILMASAWTMIAYLLNLLAAYGFTPEFATHFSLLLCAQAVVMVIGLSAVMVLLSALLPGAADVGVVLLLSVAGIVLQVMQQGLHIPGMAQISDNLFGLLYPNFLLDDIGEIRDILTFDVGRYFAVTILCITGAIAILNQKELTYGSD